MELSETLEGTVPKHSCSGAEQEGGSSCKAGSFRDASLLSLHSIVTWRFGLVQIEAKEATFEGTSAHGRHQAVGEAEGGESWREEGGGEEHDIDLRQNSAHEWW